MLRLLVVLGMMALASLKGADAFIAPQIASSSRSRPLYEASSTPSDTSSSNADPSEVVAKRIVVTGAVQGGYYRTCVLNEARRFRRLVGTMTPPDDTEVAEIYVEGKKKVVDGFIRWCRKGDVGLSQMTTVKEVIDEEPTGLYDDFYLKTH